jgi:3-deoxy-D-manno-octulosonic-acid transferase
LGLFYRLAGVVFVGKSFMGGGGQNPIEPAKLACAILHGPMVGNFAETYAALGEAGGALAIARPEDLGETLIELFANATRLRAMARAASDTVERRAGAVDRSMRALKPLLPGAGTGR